MHISRKEHAILYEYDQALQKAAGHDFQFRIGGRSYSVSAGTTSDLQVRCRSAWARWTGKWLDRSADIENTVRRHYSSYQQQSLPTYQSICFSGGGAKGVAYGGVIRQLGKRLGDVRQVSGASVGALTAMLVAAGADSEVIAKIFRSQPCKLDQKLLKQNLRQALLQCLAPYRSTLAQVLNLEETQVSDDMLRDISFRQLDTLRLALQKLGNYSLKELFVNASLYDKARNIGGEVLLSAATTPDMPLWQAGIASAALPLALPPVAVPNHMLLEGALYGPDQSEQTVLLRDGGLQNNLPHLYLNPVNKLILAFGSDRKLATHGPTWVDRIKEFLCEEPTYARGHVDLQLAQSYGMHYIDAGVSTLQVRKAITRYTELTDRSARNFNFYEIVQRPKAGRPASLSTEQNWKQLNARKYATSGKQLWRSQHRPRHS